MHASTPHILRKSRMRRRACTDLRGGRSAMVVPTATVENEMLGHQADTEAYHGRLAKARALSHRVIASAASASDEQAAAGYEVIVALREAVFGNAAEAHNRIDSALTQSTDLD